MSIGEVCQLDNLSSVCLMEGEEQSPAFGEAYICESGGQELRRHYREMIGEENITGWDSVTQGEHPVMSQEFEACQAVISIMDGTLSVLYHYSSNSKPVDLFAGYMGTSLSKNAPSIRELTRDYERIVSLQVIHEDWNLDLDGRTVFNTGYVAKQLRNKGASVVYEVRIKRKEFLRRDIVVDIEGEKVLIFPSPNLLQQDAQHDCYIAIPIRVNNYKV